MSNMRQGRYTPTTEEVCNGFHGNPRKFEQAGEPIDAIGSDYGSKCYAAFHRWLAEHDARIRREALTLTDKEARSALDMWNDVIDDCDDGVVGMQKAFDEVAKLRKEQK